MFKRGYEVNMGFDGKIIKSRSKIKITRNQMDVCFNLNKKEIRVWVENGTRKEVIEKCIDYLDMLQS